MAVALKFRFKDPQGSEKFFKGLVSKVERAAELGVAQAAEAVRAKCIDNLSGPMLDVETGTLRSSIQTDVNRNGAKTSATIGTPLVYGAAHESGATVRNGFGKGIQIHIRPRRWLNRSFITSRDTIFRIINRHIEGALS